MAISFKKSVITEAIKSVLAEAEVHVVSRENPTDDKKRIKDAMKSAGVANPQAYKDIDNLKPGDTVTTEDHAENPNDESDMAKVQLANIIHYAQELLTMIPDGMQLDAWVQDKLSISFDYIDTVKHYLEGEAYLAATQGASDEEDLQAEARKRGQGTIQKELDTVKKHMMDLAKQYKAGDKSVVEKLKDLTAQKKALEKELEDAVAGIGVDQEYAGEVDETLTEGISCCGRCGRVHESSQECKKPYISKSSPKHCSNKK